MKNNHGSETLEFKLHSFRASQRYLAHKNPTHIQHMVEDQHQFFNLVRVAFKTYFSMVAPRFLKNWGIGQK